MPKKGRVESPTRPSLCMLVCSMNPRHALACTGRHLHAFAGTRATRYDSPHAERGLYAAHAGRIYAYSSGIGCAMMGSISSYLNGLYVGLSSLWQVLHISGSAGSLSPSVMAFSASLR